MIATLADRGDRFGDLAIDSQLAASAAISGVEELLNGCICCNLVGQLGDALETLRKDVSPDRIIIETSGSAFPATLALEVNRLGSDTGNFTLDGVVVVIDVENWEGYDDTSYTAKMQARYTDLIVFNKWEQVCERRYEDCLDRVGDLEVEVATVKSDKGRVDHQLLLGMDGTTAKDLSDLTRDHAIQDSHDSNSQTHNHTVDHQEEVEVLSVRLTSPKIAAQTVNIESLETFLLAAPKTEVYRIKALLTASKPLNSSTGDVKPALVEHGQGNATYILNWAFGRWTVTPINKSLAEMERTEKTAKTLPEDENLDSDVLLQMTVVLARSEADSWKRRIIDQGYIATDDVTANFNVDIKRLL